MIDEKRLREIAERGLGPAYGASHRRVTDEHRELARAVVRLLPVLTAAEARCAAVLPDTREFEHERLTAAIKAAREMIKA